MIFYLIKIWLLLSLIPVLAFSLLISFILNGISVVYFLHWGATARIATCTWVLVMALLVYSAAQEGHIKYQGDSK